jgi:hypothetical protein
MWLPTLDNILLLHQKMAEQSGGSAGECFRSHHRQQCQKQIQCKRQEQEIGAFRDRIGEELFQRMAASLLFEIVRNQEKSNRPEQQAERHIHKIQLYIAIECTEEIQNDFRQQKSSSYSHSLQNRDGNLFVHRCLPL